MGFPRQSGEVVPFPVTIAGEEVASAAALAQLVRRDAARGGSTIEDGVGPATWLLQVRGLRRPELIGLAAALISLPEGAAIAEGCRLATALGESVLGPLVLGALTSHDVGLLLTPDPGSDGAVEDAVLAAAASVVDASNAQNRDTLLAHMRRAGRTDLELPILLEHGTADELREWLPAVLTETATLPEDTLAALRRLADTDTDRGAAARQALNATS